MWIDDISIAGKDVIEVTVVVPYMIDDDISKIRTVKLNAVKRRTSYDKTKVTLWYVVGDKTVDDLKQEIDEDLIKIKEIIDFDDSLKNVEAALRNRFAVPKKFCPFTRNTCNHYCRFYEWNGLFGECLLTR